ncbi:hypothetical protein Lal_00030909 [Lupinus albus]|uniref:Uncharacterized protein n=1 Tax=Lupinus albus TaxID=3870 RepID=A0A6A5LWJ8_LUPAL|nr:hypothetical protein Lalb_Chr17g0346041 [Lupinus albus]KAF1863800.1 hypothetical protein Lal_00030909 [Lupinus albus]
MAFTLLFMKERKKLKHGNDELAVVKAAAWAWYQHGSGSESKAVSVFDASTSRNHHAPRPSRYKLEALLRMEKEEEEAASSIHTNKTLLDAYEIESISRHLDNFIELESKQNKVDNGSNPGNASLGNGGGKMKKKMRRLRHGGICGTLKDVFDINAIWCGHKWLEIGPPRIGFR